MNIILRFFSWKKKKSNDSIKGLKISDALGDGTILDDKFQITSTIHKTKNFIFYLAIDIETAKSVIVKEYFPSEISMRDGKLEITLFNEENADEFKSDMESFVKKSNLICGIAASTGLLSDKSCFEENGTAYFVTTNLDEGDLEDDDDNMSAINSVTNIGNAVAATGADTNSLTVALNNVFSSSSQVFGETFVNATTVAGCGAVAVLTIPAASVPFDITTPPEEPPAIVSETTTESTTITETIESLGFTEIIESSDEFVEETTVPESELVETEVPTETTVLETEVTVVTTTNVIWTMPETVETTVEYTIPPEATTTMVVDDTPDTETVLIETQSYDESNIMDGLDDLLNLM